MRDTKEKREGTVTKFNYGFKMNIESGGRDTGKSDGLLEIEARSLESRPQTIGRCNRNQWQLLERQDHKACSLASVVFG